VNSAGNKAASPDSGRRRPAEPESPARAAMTAFWQSMHDNLMAPSEPALTIDRGWRWPAVMAGVVICGILIALVRLLVGTWAVARYRRGAVLIDDVRLSHEFEELQTALGCGRPVSLCESGMIGTPATIGWRRPLVLLPLDWREWTAADRRAVLAHELAHVARGDFLSGVLARLVTALHFYHPLAHLLARRMRFEQELAADACGVACSGGNESYVVALARMALHQDNRALAWAARPFLPNRSTFLRRIEMLRNTSNLKHAPDRPATRRLVLAALAAVALLVAGIRLPWGSSPDIAQAQQSGQSQKLDLKGVPEDTVVFAAIRPAAILAREEKLQEMMGVLEREMKLRENAGISPGDVEEFRLMAIDLTVPGERLQIEPVIVVKTTKPDGWRSLTAHFGDQIPDEYHGQKYFRRQTPDGGPRFGWAYFTLDDRTVVMAPTNELALKKYIDATKSGGEGPHWAAELARVEGTDAALAVDVKFFAKLLDGQMQRAPQTGEAAVALAIAPLWRQTNVLVAGAKIDGKLKAEVYGICKSEQAADEVAATLNAGKVLLQNMIPLIRREARGGPEIAEVAKLKSDLIDQMEKLLAQVKPERQGNVVSLKIEGTETFGPMMAGMLLPAIAKAREAAQRAQSINNLKQIALAMHNYADVNKTFPPAVLLGPDGKTPHSWRVAILPYIEQDTLYKQYNFNEPWDSENNKKVLERMPPVFRNPMDAANRNTSSYYVLTGKGGIFNADAAKSGTGFAQISDGTSNTVLVVEAKRDIPWTKPEDIPFDPQKELPKLGGFAHDGFAAALADGSVHFVTSAVNPQLLKAMFTASGGEPITVFEALNPELNNAPGPQRGATIRPPATESAPPAVRK
jgi:beta-lactamase regulating signal transducer with metallopeptidase domain